MKNQPVVGAVREPPAPEHWSFSDRTASLLCRQTYVLFLERVANDADADDADVQVLIPMAAGGTKAGDALKSTLILGGDQDAIVPPKRQQDGYTSSPKSKRLVMLEKAGHLAFSDLCEVGKAQGGLIKLAREYKVKIPDGFDQLIETLATDGCKEGQLPAAEGWPIIHFASSAVLEETLHCDPTASTALQGLQTRYPTVKEYKEERL